MLDRGGKKLAKFEDAGGTALAQPSARPTQKNLYWQILSQRVTRKAFTAGMAGLSAEAAWRQAVAAASEVAEAPWSVAEWAVALGFNNPRATVLVLLLSDTPIRVLGFQTPLKTSERSEKPSKTIVQAP